MIILIRRYMGIYREDGYTVEAGIEVLKLAVKNHSRLPAKIQKLARIKEGSPDNRLQRECGCPDIFISDCWPPGL